ncbi:BAHD acyltransferase At5g47980-like [Punica granatum]|uniref:BAHD acyltransferase At5g47980-like n=1 Tax=Punica granatum TaxID=22663 RepID=A0A218WUZ2_PUNGR|nr:BAHD acyltransferase At5g47980-like [Punica granatum]OWM76180.1 hypothetical protein CDL15_Pgr009826 [Punica granatum]
MEVKVHIVRRETIKPSSPTPAELGSFKLSLFDQLNPDLYTPLLLYYADCRDRDQMTGRLKSSLSKTLIHFYPLAGRITNNLLIECNDKGAEFIEAEVGCCLSDILTRPDTTVLERFLPVQIYHANARDAPLLLVQANFFKRGGLVIGVCVSHKLTDAATLSTFINAWAGEARGSREIVLPEYRLSSMFPPVDYLSSLPTVDMPRTKCITGRFVIQSSRIAALRARAASDYVPRPTAVEAVTALVWKSAATASWKNSDLRAGPKQIVLAQRVNLRKRVSPPLPNNSAGNMVTYFQAKTEETELKLQALVFHLRNGIREHQQQYIEQLLGEHGVPATLKTIRDYGVLLANERVKFYNCSSWCKFPLYTVDFGWGKPTWASVANAEFKNTILLMNTPDGEGIEVWLTLSKADMALCVHDEELLEFAAMNPSVEY